MCETHESHLSINAKQYLEFKRSLLTLLRHLNINQLSCTDYQVVLQWFPRATIKKRIILLASCVQQSK